MYDKVTVDVPQSTPQTMQLRPCPAQDDAGGRRNQLLEVRRGTQKEFSCFSLCQSPKHPEDLPRPAPFCPQCRVHGPPSLLCRRRRDTGQVQAGNQQSQCLHRLQHKLLHAAEGALDRSCHLVSSFGSRLSLRLTRHARRQPRQLSPAPSQHCSSRLASASLCREKDEQAPSERAPAMELPARAVLL